MKMFPSTTNPKTTSSMGNPYENLSTDDTSVNEISPIEHEKELKKYEKKVRHLKDLNKLNSYKREINDYLDRIQSDRERYDIPTTPEPPIQEEGCRKENSNRPTKSQLKREKRQQRSAQAKERRQKRQIREEREERERSEYEERRHHQTMEKEKRKAFSEIVNNIFKNKDQIDVLPEDIKGLIADYDKKTYRKLCLKYHPDKDGDTETFQLLSNVNDHFENL